MRIELRLAICEKKIVFWALPGKRHHAVATDRVRTPPLRTAPRWLGGSKLLPDAQGRKLPHGA